MRERCCEAAVAEHLVGRAEPAMGHDLCRLAATGATRVVDERDTERHRTKVRYRTLPAAIPRTSATCRTACPGISSAAATRASARVPPRGGARAGERAEV